MLKAYALSQDQAPYRLDERVRICKTGARILFLDQIEGLEPIHDNDAWSPDGDYQGGNAPRHPSDFAVLDRHGRPHQNQGWMIVPEQVRDGHWKGTGMSRRPTTDSEPPR